MSDKTMTDRYTDVARTAAVTFGHGMALVGAAGKAAGLPGAGRVERTGDAIAQKAVEVCGRDTPRLNRCNGPRRR